MGQDEFNIRNCFVFLEVFLFLFSFSFFHSILRTDLALEVIFLLCFSFECQILNGINLRKKKYYLVNLQRQGNFFFFYFFWMDFIFKKRKEIIIKSIREKKEIKEK